MKPEQLKMAAEFIDAIERVCREYGFHLEGSRDSPYVQIVRNSEDYFPSNLRDVEWTKDDGGYEFVTY